MNKLNVLVIGKGAREHAILMALKQGPGCGKIYSAPGNGGTAEIAQNVDLTQVDDLIRFAKENKIGLTVVGPEQPLAAGIVDQFRAAGLSIFGPTQEMAKLESSKAYAKILMRDLHVPTANFQIFDDYKLAVNYVERLPKNRGLVVKADGLAGGKAVIVCDNREQALVALKRIMIDKEFHEAGKKLVIETRLYGEEVSLMVFSDGKQVLPFETAQDYKRRYVEDLGPNTGGMGAFSPVKNFSLQLQQKIMKRIVLPIIRATNYTGILYVGLMIVKGEPFVIEFNVRLGDPETQVLLPRLKTDFLKLMLQGATGKGKIEELIWSKKVAVTFTLVTEKYPSPDKSPATPINGLKKLKKHKKIIAHHANTSLVKNKIHALPGRVLNITALAKTYNLAASRAKKAIEEINYESMDYRSDIASDIIE